MSALADHLPRHFHALLPEVFTRPAPAETKATCSACAMRPPPGEEALSGDARDRYFHAETKCCTFHPRLPNYLVGAILSDEEPAAAEGRRRLRARIASRIGVEPEWLMPPAKFLLLYARQRGAFGHARTLRCPYLDEGDCTLWRHRDAVCSTWFCRYAAGEDGRRLWSAVKEYLLLVERALARQAVLLLYPDAPLEHRSTRERIAHLSPEELDDAPPPAAEYARRWGEWAGREEAFYRACFEAVGGLSRDGVERLLGVQGATQRASLERLHSRVAAARLPERLRFNLGTRTQKLADGRTAYYAYNRLDPIALPDDAVDLLRAFSGRRTVAEVRARLRAERDADIDDDVIATLYRHRILVEA